MYIIRAGSIYEVSDGKEKEFLSPFAQEYFDQENQSWETGAWKRGDANDTAIVPRSMLWGAHGGQGKPSPPKAKFLCLRDTRLYYVLEMSRSNGLFYYDLAADREIRLFHRSEFQPRGFFVCDDYSILTTTSNPDQSVHLALLDPNGKSKGELTSGDCIDEHPFRAGDTIYYQSSGIARAEGGHIAAFSPISINKLDLTSGEIVTVHSSPDHDYLLPMVGPDGSLYCIRAPHVRPGQYTFQSLIMDVLLFPWRMCVAIFGFLNVFSVFFGKKPLKTSGGPDTPPIDISKRMLHNRLVDIEAVQKKEGRKVAVSRDWKLVRFDGEKETVLGTNVVWFNIDGNGELAFTNGYAVYGANGEKQFDCEGLVTALAVPL